jgi:hypothetical protein
MAPDRSSQSILLLTIRVACHRHCVWNRAGLDGIAVESGRCFARRSARDWRTVSSGRSLEVQKSLIVVQVALSIVLLVGAGLLTRSLRNLEDQQFVFVTDGRLIVSLINLEASGYTEEKLPVLYQRLEEALPQIPGVLSASLATYSPLEGNNWSEYVSIQGKPPDSSRTAPSWLRVGPHYFQTIGTRLLARPSDRRG